MEYTQNFLWNSGSIYIMDNHRAALWCWFQYLQKNRKYNLYHIDAHYDCLSSRIDEWRKYLPNMWNSNIHDYLNLKYETLEGSVPIFRFDNYLSLFIDKYDSMINQYKFATHDLGDKPKTSKVTNITIAKLVADLELLKNVNGEWIVNLDFDYFLTDEKKISKIYKSDQYINNIFRILANHYNQGKIKVLSIALSPDYSQGWKKAEKLGDMFSEVFDINFKLNNASKNTKMI